MTCQMCSSTRVMKFYAKCSDMFRASLYDSLKDTNRRYKGYVPDIAGFGRGDDVQGKLCLDCGQVQGTWPVEPVLGLELDERTGEPFEDSEDSEDDED